MIKESDIKAEYVGMTLMYRTWNLLKEKNFNTDTYLSLLDNWLKSFNKDKIIKEYIVIFDKTIWQPIYPEDHSNLVHVKYEVLPEVYLTKINFNVLRDTKDINDILKLWNK